MSFKDETSAQLIKHDIKLFHLQSEIKSAISKYDKIYLENLFLPGIIGEKNCRFKNMKEFIEVIFIIK